MSQSASVLFVCMGNICRSPAAEGVFRSFVETRGSDVDLIIDSAGTHGYHIGDLADPRMRQSARARGFDLASRARKVTANDLDDFDLIVAMDRDNLTIVESLHPMSTDHGKAEICLLSRFLDSKWMTDVPDPYYGGDDGFETVLDMIEAACPMLLDHLTQLAGR